MNPTKNYRLRIGNKDWRIPSCHTNIWYTWFSSSFVQITLFWGYCKILNFPLEDDWQIFPGLGWGVGGHWFLTLFNLIWSVSEFFNNGLWMLVSDYNSFWKYIFFLFRILGPESNYMLSTYSRYICKYSSSQELPAALFVNK